MVWLKRGAWIVGAVILVLAVAVLAGAMWIDTSAGKAWLTATINRAAAGQALVADIGGRLPFHPVLAKVELLDEDGVWATADQVAVDLAPADLLRRRVTITRFSIASITMLRAPLPTPEAAPPADTKDTSSAPRLPKLPVDVDVQNVSIAAIALPADIFGEATSWRMTGSTRLVGGDAALNLKASELASEPVTAEMGIELSSGRVGANALIDDPRGLLLRRSLGESRPLQFRIVDDGDSRARPPTDWRGRISGSIGDSAVIDATLHLARERGVFLVEGEGASQPGDLLSASLTPLIGDGLHFQLRARGAPDQGFTVDRLAAETATLRAQGSGSYKASGELSDVRFHLSIPDLAPFSDVAGQSMAGGADVSLTAAGPLDAWRANLDVTGHAIAFGSDSLGATSAHLEAVATSGRYEVSGDGELAKVMAGGAPLPAQLGELVQWRISMHTDAGLDRIVLTNADLRSAGLHVQGDGAFTRASQAIDGKATVTVASLDSLSEVAGTSLRGRGQIVATIDGRLPRSGIVTVRGGFDDFTTGVPVADALIGGTLQVDANAGADEQGVLSIDMADLRLANARLTAKGTADATGQAIDGVFTAAVNDLSVLRRAGLPAAGRLNLEGKIESAAGVPALDVRLNGSDLAWQTMRIDRATAHLTGKGESSPRASLTAELQARDLKVQLTGDASLSRDRKILTVPALHIRSGATAVDARLRTTLATMLTTGSLTANVPDLTPWSSLVGMELGGRLTSKLVLAAQHGQSATFELSGSDLRATQAGSEPMVVHKIAASGSGTDLLRRPSGKLVANVDGVSAGAAKLTQVRLSAASTRPGRFALHTALDGEFNGPFDLTSTADVALDGGATRATVTQLNGRVAGTPLRLERPLTVVSRGPELSIVDLLLAIGQGRIEGGAKLDATRLEVKLDAHRLPVALAGQMAGRDDLGGVLDAHVDLSGPATGPRGQVALSGADLRAGPNRRGSTPTLRFIAEAAIAPGEVKINASANVGAAQLIEASGTVPMRFGPRPGMAAIAADRDIALEAQGDGELRAIADFLPLGGDRLSGRFKIAVKASGAMADPVLTGNLSLERGHYENLSSGLLVDALDLALVAERNRITVSRLTATDGAKGRLEGSGTIALPRGDAPVLDLVVNLRRFQALRRTDATLTASGSNTVNGRLDAPKLISRLTIDQAEIFIPDPPPSAARKIPVTVVDSSTGQVLQRPEETKTAASGGILLDVDVHVPGRTFVRGRGLDSEWQGDVQVRGLSSAPEITGALKVLKGTFAFFGRDLALSRGTVTFTGGEKIEPNLDVLAETTRSETTFQVAATGTPAALKIKLSSTPALPEDEILSRMIFGREMTKLTPAQGVQLAQAVATLSSGGPGMLDKMRRKLGLDVFNIGSTEDSNDSLRPSSRPDSSGGSGGLANTGVSGGKYIAEGVYVGAEQGLSGETRSKIEVEVLPHVNVESSAGTRGESVGFNWKLDY